MDFYYRSFKVEQKKNTSTHSHAEPHNTENLLWKIVMYRVAQNIKPHTTTSFECNNLFIFVTVPVFIIPFQSSATLFKVTFNY